jgi:SAM-dependent methyltransferase
MSTSVQNPVETIFQYITGYWASQCVYVAAVLGVADHLANGSKSAEELAAITKTHPRTLYRVLRALAGLGVFTEDNGRFALTPVGEFLKSGPTGQRAMAIHLCEPNTWAAWGDLMHSVRTGEPAFKHVHGKEAFAFYADHPESFEPFNEAMTNFSMYAAASVTAAYDFHGIRTLVDVGAGHGSLLGAILRANSFLRGIAFDLPTVVEGAQSLASEPGIEGRFSIAGGDFFEAVSSGDAHIMKSIIHDWDDDRAMKILRNIHRAQQPGGKLLLVELIIGEGGGSALGKLSDLNMLVIPGGQERTVQEYGALFEKCGFKLNRVIPTESLLSIIEGVRV